jgi:alpha-tubulin suppressor-like RCC1 family protein
MSVEQYPAVLEEWGTAGTGGQAGAPSSCGNGTCDSGESAGSCPQDCVIPTISAGYNHSCGARADGTAWCWGGDEGGQLGDGWPSSHQDCADLAYCSMVPVQVSGLSDVVGISAGDSHSCALKRDGTRGAGGPTRAASSVTGP